MIGAVSHPMPRTTHKSKLVVRSGSYGLKKRFMVEVCGRKTQKNEEHIATPAWTSIIRRLAQSGFSFVPKQLPLKMLEIARIFTVRVFFEQRR